MQGTKNNPPQQRRKKPKFKILEREMGSEPLRAVVRRRRFYNPSHAPPSSTGPQIFAFFHLVVLLATWRSLFPLFGRD